MVLAFFDPSKDGVPSTEARTAPDTRRARELPRFDHRVHERHLRKERPMIIRPKTHLLLLLLALSVALATATSARAQDRHYGGSDGTSATLQISFGTTPHWTGIRGTNVRVIRERERPDYDMFRYGRNYYVYRDNHWYTSRRWRGQFTLIDDRLVPRELSRVPRQHWRNYPSGWSDQDDESRQGRHDRRR
jgi:hypothetical protein